MTEQRSQLRQRLKAALAPMNAVAPRGISRSEGPVVVPATAEQCQFWYMDQLAPGKAVANSFRAWRIRGPFDPRRILNALHILTRKHDSLRANFAETSGVVQMTVHQDRAVDFAQVDLRDRPGALTAAMSKECERAFDLRSDPLMRVRAIHVGSQEWILLLVVHHAIMDGWSLRMFGTELGNYYRDASLSADRLAYDFADYANDLTSKASPREEAQLSQPWRPLQQPVSALALPYDYAPPAKRGFSGASTRFTLGEASFHAIEALASKLHMPPASVVAAVFRVALFVISGQRDFCIGNVVMNRDAPGLPSVIGAFVRVLPVQHALKRETSFEDICRAELHAIGRAVQNEITAEGVTSDHSGHLPQTSTSDAVQVVLNYRGFSTQDLDLTDCTAHAEPLPVHAAPFELTLNLERNGGSLNGELVWNTDLFSAKTANRIVGTFEETLHALLRAPSAPLEATTRTLGTKTVSAPQSTRQTPVVDLLEQAFGTFANQPALRLGGEEWTYRDLEEASAAWANALINAPGAPGDLVALALPRGAEFVAAMIGILRSGRAFLPLSPADPPERLKRILCLAQPAHFIGSHELAEALDRRVLTARKSARVPWHICQPDDLAYVMFTSGSTGEPKGVAIPHQAISNLLAAVCEVFPHEAGDCLLSVSATTFDSILYETLAPLITGGTLVMVEEAFLRDPWHITEKLRSTAPRHFFATPSLWRMLLEADLPDLPGLEALIGGEALSSGLADKILPHVGRLINIYGPTETTVFSTWSEVRQTSGHQRGANITGHPIGRPLPGYRAAIMDDNGCSVWPGMIGEIWLSGPGLATGYHNDPQRTQERFVTKNGETTAGRWYKTGDLGRVLDDGSIGYAGRADEQIKISGQRVEPGEIENLVMESGLADAAAVFLASFEGEPTLLAFFVPRMSATKAAVQSYLRAHLPTAWVPGFVAACEKLPLTASGKLDRAALGDLARRAMHDTATEAHHILQISSTVQDCWTQTLGKTATAPDQNFFDVGGNSLLMIKMLAEIRACTSCHLPVAEAFADPTPSGIDRLLKRAKPQAYDEALVALNNSTGSEPLVFLPGLAPTGPNLTKVLRNVPEDCAVYALQRLEIPSEASERGFAANTDHFADVLRKSFPDTQLHIAGFSFGGAEAFETARQLVAHDMPKPKLTIIDTGPIFQKLNPLSDQMSTYANALEALRRTHAFGVWDGDLRLVRGDRFSLISLAKIAYGWEDFVTGQVSVHQFPASHDEMLRDYAGQTVRAALGPRPPDITLCSLPGASERRRAAHLIAAGDLHEALDCLCGVALDNPMHPWSAVAAEQLASDLNLDRKALLEVWLSQTPSAPPSGVPALAWHAGRALAFQRLSLYEASLAEIEAASAVAGPRHALDVSKGILLHQTGRAEQASEVLTLASKRWGLTKRIEANLGLSLAKHGQLERALPYLREAHKKLPRNMPVQIWLARAEAVSRSEGTPF